MVDTYFFKRWVILFLIGAFVVVLGVGLGRLVSDVIIAHPYFIMWFLVIVAVTMAGD